MREVLDKDTGAILYKKTAKERKLDAILAEYDSLKEEVRELRKLVESLVSILEQK